ncbi:hypothetical protein [Salinibacillus aidingensis]
MIAIIGKSGVGKSTLLNNGRFRTIIYRYVLS